MSEMIDIPSYSTDDALQGFAVGPDGYVYLAGDETWKTLFKVDDIPKVKALERQLAEYRQDLANRAQQLSEADQEIELLKFDITTLRSSLEQADNRIEELDIANSALREKLEGVTGEREAAKYLLAQHSEVYEQLIYAIIGGTFDPETPAQVAYTPRIKHSFLADLGNMLKPHPTPDTRQEKEGE